MRSSRSCLKVRENAMTGSVRRTGMAGDDGGGGADGGKEKVQRCPNG